MELVNDINLHRELREQVE